MNSIYRAIWVLGALLILTSAPLAQQTITVEIPGLADGAIQLELVRIPAGTFIMGTSLDAKERWPEEFPPHQVTISKDFYLGKYEVTQAQWRAVHGGTPSRYDYPLDENHPVESISIRNIEEFFEDLVDDGIGQFRLPTEAEWEYACRAGTTTPYFWGDTSKPISSYAWYYSNAGGRHHPVGQKLPNPWGLYDMTGNAFEFCADYWREGFEREPQVDPFVERDTRYRVIKGGGYKNNAHRTRPAWRYLTEETRRNFNFGFRVAMDIENVPVTQTRVSDWSIH
ncbi:MAG: formylglycine-generating enzyme family protein [Candidatus Hinthialibacter antarcticus]|nr:formylglycine-generating enzyme family protein [Candidatus Hinthialibacter antarcticus]